jgi:hypothetical protein
MVEIKTHRDHSSSMAERISKRLRNSGDPSADVVTKTGDSARRTFHNLHFTGNVHSTGPDHKGEPGIDGKMRGPANPQGEIK